MQLHVDTKCFTLQLKSDAIHFFVFQKEFAAFMELLSKATIETMVKLIHDRISAQVLEATAKSQLSKLDKQNGMSLFLKSQ